VISCRQREQFRAPARVIVKVYLDLMKEKRTNDEKRDLFLMLHKLISDGTITPVETGLNGDISLYAQKLMDRVDGLDTSAALTAAGALVDEECIKIYTADSGLLFSRELHITVAEIRNGISPSAPEPEFVTFGSIREKIRSKSRTKGRTGKIRKTVPRAPL
jgi:hypothetical protein